MIISENLIKYKLNNGLNVILYSDKSFPDVAINIWYKVGAANEKKGETGLAHLCEHLMFQGSVNVPKEAHFKFIEEVGGVLNGSTSQDRTNYYETVPANNLELALWLESDRMGLLLPALDDEKFKNQLNVVINERKQRYDNKPYGRAWELIFSNLFPENHPYHNPVIGWQTDLDNMTIDKARQFISTYYSPNNASLVIAGNLDIEETKEMVEAYFGEFKPTDIPKINFTESNLTETRQMVYYDDVKLPAVYMVWQAGKEFTDEDFALTLAADILDESKTKHLYKKLVYDEKVAVGASVLPILLKQDGLFIISAIAHDLNSIDRMKQLIWEVINNIKKEKFNDTEVKRYLNKYKSSKIFGYQKISGLANKMNFYNSVLGTPDGFDFEEKKYNEINAELVSKYFIECVEKPYFELTILPKEVKNDNR
ncbi:MAG TPA: pitrilysin family protein [Melioribacteraceae bacterium]|nr:pitrilysin family protein [Melioribacteraceae bacterium]